MDSIYLQDFELALEMKKAGFNKECVFQYRKIYQYGIYDEYTLFACGINTGKVVCFDSKLECPEVLNLPALGEIDLPEDLTILKRNSKYMVAGRCMVDKNSLFMGIDFGRVSGIFETEIEARAHAWLWANKKEAQDA